MDGPRAIVLDVGGVLLLPQPDLVGAALEDAGVDHDPLRLEVAHYHAVAAVDAAGGGSAPERLGEVYIDGWLRALRIAPDQRTAARDALVSVLSRPSLDVWTATTPWARPGLAALDASGVPLAVVSNSDGTVATALRTHRLCQVGPGRGAEVVEIVDSTEIGVAKPDPAVFDPALDALGLPGRDCWYVGDTVTYDVAGARAAGLVPVHLDPFGLCPAADDHGHVADLVELVAQLEQLAASR